MTAVPKPLLAALLAVPTMLPAQEDFSFDTLRAKARTLAAAPYVPAPDNVPDHWKNLTYDQHREIRFRPEEGLWWEKDQSEPFTVEFFHPGWTAKKTVDVSEVINGKSTRIPFDPKQFDYRKAPVPAGTPSPRSFAGWRLHTHLNKPDYMDECLVFLGASYFRAVPAKGAYGLSARGLSVNSARPDLREEFPDFTEFHLQKPAKGDKSFKAWALLDGESVSGAYQFTVTPGPETVMDIEMELTLRKPVQQLGLAPFSSMFWFGENTHPRPYDFRPEVHDSDGLLMELGSGNLHFRPLETTRDQFRHCVFTMEKPRSWSLVQRDRSFSSYLDVEAAYHHRPTAKVVPVEGFDLGKLHLIEMPTHDETEDNIVLVWEPQPQLEVGKSYRFHYRLHWQHDPVPSGLFEVKATRLGNPVKQHDRILVAVDFAKPLYPEKKVGDPKWEDASKFKPVLSVTDPSVKVIHVGLTDLSMPNVDDIAVADGRNPAMHMPQVLRAFFVLEPPKDLKQIDMTCELQDENAKVVSERWVYLWKKTH